MNQAATIKFLAILEKNKPTRILPVLQNLKELNAEDMGNIPIREIFSNFKVKIPNDISPWNKISENADVIFLALQSRKSWGADIDESTELLKVDEIMKIIQRMEESLNDCTFMKDYASGKFEEFSFLGTLKKDKIKAISEFDHPIPGQNWL